MKKPSRFLALWLTLTLGFPSPALALRAVGLEESNQQPVLRKTLAGTPRRSHEAGLEEPQFPSEAVRIALVEDEVFQLNALQTLVTGYLARSANPLAARIKPDQIGAFPTTEAAIAWITKEKPQMVITDLNLPDGLGFAVIAAAKQANPSAAAVLASTPYPTQQAMVDQLLADGTLNHFLRKPFSVSKELFPLVDQYIVQRLTAGMEEDPIAAALKRDGVAAVDVAADGTVRLNGQIIMVPPELRKPGFFKSGQTVIIMSAPERPNWPLPLSLLHQVPIGSPSDIPAMVIRVSLTHIGTAEALKKIVGQYASTMGPSTVVVYKAPLLSTTEARQLMGRSLIIAVHDTVKVSADDLPFLIAAANRQGGSLLILGDTYVRYRNDHVLLIAA